MAHEVSQALRIPLDICLVRKLGVPSHPELAMGAIASDGVRVFNDDIINALKIPETIIEHVAKLELQELNRRDRAYRGNRPPPEIKGHSVIVIDDGLATGMTMRAAIAQIKSQQAKKIMVAVPVAPAFVCRDLKKEVDQVVCLQTPSPFHAIGLWYERFPQVTDEEVNSLLGHISTETAWSL